LEDALRDLSLLRLQLLVEREEPLFRLVDREVAHLRYRETIDLDGERLWLQPLALAGRARAGGLEARQLLAHPGAVGLTPAPVHVGDDALEGPGRLVAAHPIVIFHGDRLAAGAMQDDVARLFRQLLPGRVDAELVVPRQAVQRLHVVLRGRVGPRRDGALPQRQLLVRHDELGIKEHGCAEPIAGRAGAIGVVEREEAGLDLVDGEARYRAGELGREGHALRPALLLALGRIR